MKFAVAEAWIEMLRSGEYRQCRGALRMARHPDHGGEGFCCLGVACVLYQKHHPDSTMEWTDVDDHEGHDHPVQFDGQGELPPADVQRWMGLSNEGIQVLTRMNDSGVPFSDIAKFIEVGWERL